MAIDAKELEDQLFELGNMLADPPSSVEELLSLLNQIERCLSRVEQAPKKSMKIALSPSLKALAGDKLLSHSDPDVKVAIASCISEITRITAPEAPYDDEKMKEIFQLVVSSFENLHDKSSQSYTKRTSILETVAKVRSCVVMLDLECDALILEMFQHFLKAIREHHPEGVFSCMETIMSLVIEESEDISFDLLSPLLDSIKKDNKEVFPIARKLGETVLENCATKLKPYLVQAVRTLGISVDDYSKVLASICQDTSECLEKNGVYVTGEHVADKGKSAKQSVEESTQVVKDEAKEDKHLPQDNRDGNRASKSVTGNSVARVAEDDTLAESKSIEKNEELDDLGDRKVGRNEQTPKQHTKKSRRKSSYSTKSAKPSESQVVAKKSEKTMDSESQSKEVLSSLGQDQERNDEEIQVNISSPKARNEESEVVASPSPSDSLLDKKHSEKLGKAKTKDSLANVEVAEVVSKKASEGASLSKANPVKRSGVKKTAGTDSGKKQSGTASGGTDANKHSAKKLDDNEGGGGSSSRQLVDKIKQGEANSETGAAKSSTPAVDKEIVSSPRSNIESSEDEKLEETMTTKTNAKRKHASGRKNGSEIKQNDKSLVGLRVEVWWPKDRQFYKGVIDSFNFAKKKHKVVYDDGEVEVLNLAREKWNVIEADLNADGEEGSDTAGLETSPEMPPKKRGKTNSGEPTKQGKLGLFSSGGTSGSSKSKGVLKSGQKSKDGIKSKESKNISSSEDEANRKLKESTPKSGSSKSAAQKMTSKSKNIGSSKTSKSKDDDIITPKPSVNSKQETPKTETSKEKTPKTSASEGKPPKRGGKSTVDNGSKVKFDSCKKKDLVEEDSDVSEREVEDTEGKPTDSSKAQGSEAKRGNKRQRS